MTLIKQINTQTGQFAKPVKTLRHIDNLTLAPAR